MAPPPGSVRVTGYVGPSDTADPYPCQTEEYGRGGFRSVTNAAARLAITADRRKEGMLVKQLDTGGVWTLSGGIADINWVLDPLGVADSLRKIINIGEVFFVDADAGVDAVNRGTYALPLKTITYAINNYAVADRNDLFICWSSAGGTFNENTGAGGCVITTRGVIVLGIGTVGVDNTNGGASSVFHLFVQNIWVGGFRISPTVPIIGIRCAADYQKVGMLDEYANVFENCSVDVQFATSCGFASKNFHRSSAKAYDARSNQCKIFDNHIEGNGAGGSIGVDLSLGASKDNEIHDNYISGFETGINAVAGAVGNAGYDNSINCTNPIVDANAPGLNNWSGNSIVPVKTIADFTYLAGVAEQDAFVYTATDNLDRRIVGSFDLDAHITAAKIMTVRVKEMIDGANYRTIDSKTYIVGTDPAPHFDFLTFRTCKVTLKIDITEGVDRAIPRSVSVRAEE